MRKHSERVREYFLLNINAVIKLLIISDVIWVGSLGLLTPIFSLFIVGFIDGGNAVVAGTAAAIYLVVKSIFQIPAAMIIDKIKGEKDDFYVLFFGSLCAGLVPLSYLFIHTPAQLYAVQFLYGLVVAFTFPSFMAIFTRHIDKNKEGTEWGAYFTLTDFTTAIAASIGGVLAQFLGFHVLIVVMVCISICGISMMYPIRKHVYKRRRAG